MSTPIYTTEGREVMRDGEGAYFLANDRQAKEIAEKLNLLDEMRDALDAMFAIHDGTSGMSGGEQSAAIAKARAIRAKEAE